MPRREKARSYGRCMFNVWETAKPFSKVVAPFSIPASTWACRSLSYYLCGKVCCAISLQVSDGISLTGKMMLSIFSCASCGLYVFFCEVTVEIFQQLFGWLTSGYWIIMTPWVTIFVSHVFWDYVFAFLELLFHYLYCSFSKDKIFNDEVQFINIFY